MPERRPRSALSAERTVGVDAAGQIAVVVGVVGTPSALWGEMLVRRPDRPAEIARLVVSCPGGTPTQPPTQIELRVAEPDHIHLALDWLRSAMEQVDGDHDAQQRHLATIYSRSRDLVDDWYRRSGAADRADPRHRLN